MCSCRRYSGWEQFPLRSFYVAGNLVINFLDFLHLSDELQYLSDTDTWEKYKFDYKLQIWVKSCFLFPPNYCTQKMTPCTCTVTKQILKGDCVLDFFQTFYFKNNFSIMLIINKSLKPHYISHCNNPHTIIFDDHHLCVSVTGALVCGLGFCDCEKIK